jgi:hypothetical protein
MRPKTTEKKSILHRLTRLAVLLARLIKQIWAFPSIVAIVLRQRRRLAALDADEAERLDRIRNPSDYLGK